MKIEKKLKSIWGLKKLVFYHFEIKLWKKGRAFVGAKKLVRHWNKSWKERKSIETWKKVDQIAKGKERESIRGCKKSWSDREISLGKKGSPFEDAKNVGLTER